MVRDIPLSLVVSFGYFWGYFCCIGDMSFHVKINFQNSILHPFLGCIRILWLVSHPLGLGLDKALCGWNSVSPHEWVPSVFNYSHPNTPGYASWAPDPSAWNKHDPRKEECGNIHQRTIHTLSILSETPNIFVKNHDQKPTTIDYNLKPYFGLVNADTIKKTNRKISMIFPLVSYCSCVNNPSSS